MLVVTAVMAVEISSSAKSQSNCLTLPYGNGQNDKKLRFQPFYFSRTGISNSFHFVFPPFSFDMKEKSVFKWNAAFSLSIAFEFVWITIEFLLTSQTIMWLCDRTLTSGKNECFARICLPLSALGTLLSFQQFSLFVEVRGREIQLCSKIENALPAQTIVFRPFLLTKTYNHLTDQTKQIRFPEIDEKEL